MTENVYKGAAPVPGRADVMFDSGDDKCAAWLYRPQGVESPPIVVMAHGFGAIRELRLDAYAQRFAKAGYAVLAFDYRNFGASTGQPPELLSLSRQHEDWRAALAYGRSLKWVDRHRVVAWGSSLGGGHVLHTASKDHDLAAVIAQVPHVSGPASLKGMGIAHVARLGVAGLRDEIRHLLGRPPYYIASIGDTGTFAVMLEPEGIDILRRLAEGHDQEALLSRNRVAARILLRMAFYSPGRHAISITAPTLIQAGEHDRLTPTTASAKVASRIDRAEFKSYPCGHFDPYLEPYFEEVVGDQIAFLRKHVPIGAPKA